MSNGEAIKESEARQPGVSVRRRDRVKDRKAFRREAYAQAKIAPAHSRRSNRIRDVDTEERWSRTDSKAWLPSAGNIFGRVEPDSGYVQFHIAADCIQAMLGWIAPGFLEKTAVSVARKTTRAVEPPRSASALVFVSTTATDSATHCDTDDGLLLVVCGERTVTWAPPRTVTPAVDRDCGDGVRYPCEDTAWPPAGSTTVVLRAGDAVLLPRGWWHRVSGAPGSVGVSVDVVSGSRASPHVWRRAGLTRARAGWSSARALLKLLARIDGASG